MVAISIFVESTSYALRLKPHHFTGRIPSAVWRLESAFPRSPESLVVAISLPDGLKVAPLNLLDLKQNHKTCCLQAWLEEIDVAIEKNRFVAVSKVISLAELLNCA